MPKTKRSVWTAAPPVALAPRRGDLVFLGVLLAAGVVELAVRPELSLGSPSVLVGFLLMPAVLFRSSRPFTTVAAAFGATAALSGVELVAGIRLEDLNTTVFMLVLPYALFRWGAGRQALAGAGIIMASAVLGLAADRAPLGEWVGAFAVLSLALALGAAFRYRADARERELEQVKMREREQLARDLHDTVAHHVSAIAVQAQAGLATANHRPEAPLEALKVIEAEASRTLREMRAMVRVLRKSDEEPELAPSPSLRDLERLARAANDGPRVEVEIAQNLGEIAAPVSAAIFRLAQESITNARRHARRATRIAVGVTGNRDSVELNVSDDGEPAADRQPARLGYGLIGMAERAQLLGGSCRAGPNPDRGWTVTAVLPRQGVAS